MPYSQGRAESRTGSKADRRSKAIRNTSPSRSSASVGSTRRARKRRSVDPCRSKMAPKASGVFSEPAITVPSDSSMLRCSPFPLSRFAPRRRLSHHRGQVGNQGAVKGNNRQWTGCQRGSDGDNQRDTGRSRSSWQAGSSGWSQKRVAPCSWREAAASWRIDGYTVESSALGGPPMHNGELHPDADELLYLLSGRIRVRLELEGGDREAEVRPGQALAIPRGTWHHIIVDQPGQLVNVTPGPGGQYRPLREA